MKSSYLSYFWWFFLPRVVGWIQWFGYSIVYRAGEPKPQPGTVKFIQHYRRIYTAIVIAYILFTIYQADWDLQREGDLYQLLGIPVDVDDSGLKSRFRTLTRLFHPDKVTSGNTEAVHDFYVQLKDARDALAEPAKRYAYDRLGPDILGLNSKGKSLLTIKDYVYNAAMSTIIPYYVGTSLVLFALNILGFFPSARYWRYFSLLAVLTFELHILTRSTWPIALTHFINPLLMHLFKHPALLPYQLISILRTAAISLFIGVHQIQSLPPTTPPTARSTIGLSPVEADKLVQNQLNFVEDLTKHLESESMRLLEMESAPFFGAGLKGEEQIEGDQDQVQQILREKLKEWLIQNVLRSNPQVKDAEGRVLARRRRGVPAGAKGTK